MTGNSSHIYYFCFNESHFCHLYLNRSAIHSILKDLRLIVYQTLAPLLLFSGLLLFFLDFIFSCVVSMVKLLLSKSRFLSMKFK